MMYPRNRKLVLAKIIGLRDSACFAYPSCRECCTKLLHEAEQEIWMCVRCGQQYSKDNINMRYRVALHIADSSTSCTITVFGQNMEPCFGASAVDFCRLSDEVRQKFPYDAEHLLEEALVSTLVGKMFYFGFKSSASCQNQSGKQVTIKDILDANQKNKMHRLESKTNGLIAFQMFPACDDMKENQATVTSVLNQLVDHYASNPSTNSAFTNSMHMHRSFSSNIGSTQNSNHSCSSLCGAYSHSYNIRSCRLNSYSNQSSLVLSSDSIHIKDTSLNNTSTIQKQTSPEPVPEIKLESVRHCCQLQTSISNLTPTMSDMANLQETNNDETVDWSIELLRAGSQSYTLMHGSPQLTVSIIKGIDFDEMLDISSDLMYSTLNLTAQRTNTIQIEDVNDICDDIDCSSILVPLNDPELSHEIKGIHDKEQNALYSSSNSSLSKPAVLPGGLQVPISATEHDATVNLPHCHVIISELAQTSMEDNCDRITKCNNVSNRCRTILCSPPNPPSIHKCSSSNQHRAIAQAESWEQMPESEDLDQFLRGLEMNDHLVESPVVVQKCETSIPVHDLITNVSELCSQKPTCLQEGNVNCTSKNSKICDTSCNHATVSLLSDVPYSEDLDAFMKELDNNETFGDMPQIQQHSLHQRDNSLDNVENQDVMLNGEYCSNRDADSHSIQHCSLHDNSSPCCTGKHVSKVTKHFECESSVRPSVTDTSIVCKRASLSEARNPQNSITNETTLNLVLTVNSLLHNSLEQSNDQANNLSDDVSCENLQNNCDGKLSHSEHTNRSQLLLQIQESAEQLSSHNVTYSESLFGDHTTNSSIVGRTSLCIDGSCDMFDQSEDLFSSSLQSHVPLFNGTDSSSDCGSFLSISQTKPSMNMGNILPKLQAGLHSNTGQKLKWKTVHFPSSSKLAEAENISSIDRQMKVNCTSVSILPEKSCLCRSAELPIEDRNYEIMKHVAVHRTIADLFTVNETPINLQTRTCRAHQKESDNDTSLNILNVKQDLSHAMLLQTDVSQGEGHADSVSSSDDIIAGSQDLFSNSPSPPTKYPCLATNICHPVSSCCATMHESTPVLSSDRIHKHLCSPQKLNSSKKRRMSQKILDIFSFSSVDDSLICVNNTNGSLDMFSEDEIDNSHSGNNLVSRSNHASKVMSTSNHKDVLHSCNHGNNDLNKGNNRTRSDTTEESFAGNSQDLFDD